MFKQFLTSELKYTLKQPMVYIFTFFIAVLVFAAVSSDNVSIGGAVGNVYKNSPHVISVYVSILSIFGLLFATAFFNNAALRDYKYQFHEILFTTPLSKVGYYFGRFLGALIVSTIPFMGIYLGVILATFIAPAVGWEQPDRFGPFYLKTFINTYVLFILPNMFFAGAVIYALAQRFRSTVVSFVGSLVIIISYIASGSLMSDLDNETLGAVLDVFGIRSYGYTTKYFTPNEKNTISVGFEGLFFYSRMLWVAVAVVITSISYALFSFKEPNKKGKAVAKEEFNSIAFKKPSLSSKEIMPSFTTQFSSFFKINFLSIYKSIVFRILGLFSAILLLVELIGGFEYFGLQSYPLTYKMIDAIDSSANIFVIIILVFFSGELIWRDRESHINEVIDATPHSSFASLFAKALSLAATVYILRLIFILVGILYQLVSGYTRIELSVYILDFFYSHFFSYLFWSFLFVGLQVLINQRYLGYFISILFLFGFSIILNIAEIESNMVYIGSTPGYTYSDMNGFGPSINATMWYNVYWLLFGLFLLMISGMAWSRGVPASLKQRIKRTKNTVKYSYKVSTFGILALFTLVASWIYYNTQVINGSPSQSEREAISVKYEKTYKKYQNMARPKIKSAKYFVDIYPAEQNLKAKVEFMLQNETNEVIDSIHFNLNPRWDVRIELPKSHLAVDDVELDYRIYALTSPMKPGEMRKLTVYSDFISEGFRDGPLSTSIIENGTFINNFAMLPNIGYSADAEISDKNKRKELGLPEKDRMPELAHPCNGMCGANYLSGGLSDYIPIETIISTVTSQVAIAPGSLLNKWEEDDRVYYHYKLDHASQHFMNFISAEYQLASRRWQDVDIEVYFHKDHEVNVEMMLDAVERSLEYYTENFGPYYHKQCRIIEFPRYATFAQAFPGTMPYSEAFGFVTNLEDEEGNNVIDAVIAHEMAHQWWAHQLVGADMQGGTFLSEAFAEYSSLMTMKSITPTPMKMREFLKYDHNRYLRGRSFESEKELPIYQVENQTYIHYGKGSVVLYALQDYIGEDSVNMAMREFLEEFKYTAPYPTSEDFLKYLEPKIPDSLSYIMSDWFRNITLYDNRITEANYKELDNGKFEITMQLVSKKMESDSLGVENEIPLKDYIDIGLFADADEKDLMYVNRVLLSQPETTIVVTVDSLPAKASIDPKHLLIDRVFSDNVKTVKAI